MKTFICETPLWIWIAILWEIVWKIIGLRKAIHYKDSKWFWMILLLNTVGILPMIYVLILKRNK